MRKLLILLALFPLATFAQTTNIWRGLTNNAAWSDSTAWSAGAVPTLGTIALFATNSAAGAGSNTSCRVDVGISANGLIVSNYSGTLTFSTGNTHTLSNAVGQDAFKCVSGTVNFTNSTVNMWGNYNTSGAAGNVYWDFYNGLLVMTNNTGTASFGSGANQTVGRLWMSGANGGTNYITAVFNDIMSELRLFGGGFLASGGYGRIMLYNTNTYPLVIAPSTVFAGNSQIFDYGYSGSNGTVFVEIGTTNEFKTGFACNVYSGGISNTFVFTNGTQIVKSDYGYFSGSVAVGASQTLYVQPGMRIDCLPAFNYLANAAFSNATIIATNVNFRMNNPNLGNQNGKYIFNNSSFSFFSYGTTILTIGSLNTVYATNAIFNVNLGYANNSGALTVNTPLLGATWCGGATLGAALNVNSLVSTGSVTFATAGYQLTASTITNSGTIVASNSTIIVSDNLYNTGTFSNMTSTVIVNGSGNFSSNVTNWYNLYSNSRYASPSNNTGKSITLTNRTHTANQVILLGTPTLPVQLLTVGGNAGTLNLSQPSSAEHIVWGNWTVSGKPLRLQWRQSETNKIGRAHV